MFGAIYAPAFGGFIQFYKGDLDDVRIYDNALSALDVAVLLEMPVLTFVAPPGPVVVSEGQPATFTASAVVTGLPQAVIGYQWLRNGAPVSGATQSSYTIPAASAGDSGAEFTVVAIYGNQQVTSMAATLTVSVPATLLGRWDFEEESGDVAVDSAGQHNGTIVGATRIQGRSGARALRFDGIKSRVEVGGAGSPLDLAGKPYSIAFWMRAAGSTGQQYQRIMAMDDGVDFSGGYSVHLNNGVLSATHNTGTLDRNWNTGYTPGHDWIHVAITAGGGMRHLYVNGVPTAAISTPDALATDGNDPLVFGAINAPTAGGVIQFYSGDLDEIRIYRGVLTDADVKALANATQTLAAKVSIANPSFEQLAGSDSAHFDPAGHLIPDHFSQFPGSSPGPTGFTVADAIPGWSGGPIGGTIAYGGSSLFPSGLPDGSNCAWIDGAGVIHQTLDATFQANLNYTLSVNVGGVTGMGSPGYSVGLYANGQAVAVDVNSTHIPSGGFGTARVSAVLPPGSPWLNAPIEIRLSGLDSGPGRTLFDKVSLWTEVVQAPAGSASAPAGLVAWFRGEENSVDSVRGRAGTFDNPSYGQGEVGRAFHFNGANQVTIADAPELNPTSFTLEAWVFLESLDGTVDVIASKESGGITQFALGIRGPANAAPGPVPDPGEIPVGNLCARLGGYEGLPKDANGWVDGLVSIPLNTWSHVALVVQPDLFVVYVNGAQARRIAGLAGSIVVTDGAIRIASRTDEYIAIHPEDRFNGFVDEFSLYNRALQGSEIDAVAQSGHAGKFLGPIPAFVTVPPQNAIVVAGKDATFEVVANGTLPLSYQWRFNGKNIPDATNSNLIVPAARMSAQGRYSVVVCNGAGCVASPDGLLTVTPAPTTVSAVAKVSQSPRVISVAIGLSGSGLENALGFSLRFDAGRLGFIGATLDGDATGAQLLVNDSKAASGLLGFGVALPAGAVFAEGANRVLQLSFGKHLILAPSLATFQFGDTPTVRQVADVSAKALGAVWLGGSVVLGVDELEGDVSPLPGGDKAVGISDWVQVGRFVAGLDDLPAGSLFQRADCAPLATFGNGYLTLSDWIQAGRFAAGLDLLEVAGGPTDPVSIPPSSRAAARLASVPTRVVSMSALELLPGQTNDVPVMLAASGDENGVAFSVRFDPAVLRFVGVTSGSSSGKATFNVNSKNSDQGSLGVALALGTNAKFPGGSLEIARLRFAATSAAKGATNLRFADLPVFREVADPLATPLPAVWQDAAVNILPVQVGSSIDTTGATPSLVLTWPSALNGVIVEGADTLDAKVWNPVPGTPVTKDQRTSLSVPLGTTTGYFRLQLP
ncbi:MAG: hypothetical protein DVB31_08190 [Verrucomicrobia bacterium]|nr:MAG: hypothetical protein DVB31_08190 [Verrucomicrobiota bacterium]